MPLPHAGALVVVPAAAEADETETAADERETEDMDAAAGAEEAPIDERDELLTTITRAETELAERAGLLAAEDAGTSKGLEDGGNPPAEDRADAGATGAVGQSGRNTQRQPPMHVPSLVHTGTVHDLPPQVRIT